MISFLTFNRLCGRFVNKTLKSTTNLAVLKFHSNDSKGKKGFRIAVKTAPKQSGLHLLVYIMICLRSSIIRRLYTVLQRVNSQTIVELYTKRITVSWELVWMLLLCIFVAIKLSFNLYNRLNVISAGVKVLQAYRYKFNSIIGLRVNGGNSLSKLECRRCLLSFPWNCQPK